jgi:exosortase A-associated hydrolase 2
MPPEAFFLPAHKGVRFCLLHRPTQAARGLVVYVHPFAEEMNKSRRMAALQARSLAQAGFVVLQIDLHGCGDSSGDFGDATWADWVDDVVQASHWLRNQDAQGSASQAAPPLWLWGLRAGCLVAAEAAKQLEETCNFLFWQPPSSGKPLVQQFLRLKVAGEILGGQAKGIMDSLRQSLASGASVEIAGYQLSPGLAFGLEQSTLAPPALTTDTPRVEWFELSTREDATLSPVSVKTCAEWQHGGKLVRSHVVQGPSFWQTTEIEDAPALIGATTAALTNSAP